MQLARVIGTATATVKHASMEGWKLLIVRLLMADGRSADGEPVIVVDALGAGAGQRVLLTTDGRYTRELLDSDTTPVRWSVMGICD
ncbi:MAG: ethanolamine utilization protein EutN [Planctomycetota bacterium]|nr:MAG: ethanolamine utilization protein EutN [Planctomycetota bacterium]REJ94543.1 MAG: ethanolamine utilization protein EutN [Planctomycetota bacterium]REK18595.1 MAG: ethanolamine utilization protein EutN [Planctomycetota bacterium]REK37491.1 MAG: ethanolamine utilization protein EutN [Planctomycetota bacterium]